MEMGSQGAQTKHIVVAIAFILVSGILFLLLKQNLFSAFTVERVKAYVASFGLLAPLAYITILALAIIISQIPNIPLALASGTLFGPLLGGLYSLIGGMLGAVTCFYIARTLGIVFVRKLFGKTIYFCDQCSETYIGLIIFFSRLFPFISFDLISYCAGLTNIRIRTFFVATLFGMIPMTFLFTHLGVFLLLNQTLSSILTLLLIVLFFGAPLLVRKFNLFGLRQRILFK